MRKISRRSFIKAATFTAAAAALTACGGSSSSTTTASSTAASAAADNTPSNKGTGVTLNVYTNSDTDGRDEWLIERAAQDGFKVQVVGAGAADTQNRLLAEKASPIADVVFGLNAIIWESLKAENILIPFVGRRDPRRSERRRGLLPCNRQAGYSAGLRSEPAHRGSGSHRLARPVDQAGVR